MSVSSWCNWVSKNWWTGQHCWYCCHDEMLYKYLNCRRRRLQNQVPCGAISGHVLSTIPWRRAIEQSTGGGHRTMGRIRLMRNKDKRRSTQLLKLTRRQAEHSTARYENTLNVVDFDCRLVYGNTSVWRRHTSPSLRRQPIIYWCLWSPLFVPLSLSNTTRQEAQLSQRGRAVASCHWIFRRLPV